MRAGGGKQKGSQFEREVCHDLSLWWTKGARDDSFWRSAMSGGRATVASKQGRDLGHVSGDICAVHELGYPFVDKVFAECKFYADLLMHGLYLDLNTGINGHWTVCSKGAAQYGKVPLLIAKQNRSLPIVGTNAAGLRLFKLKRQTIAYFRPRNLYLVLYKAARNSPDD